MAHEYVYWNGGHTDGGCTTHNGIGPRMNDWNKGTGNGHAEHVCRPVIVDAQGRKRPIVCFDSGSNTETYVTKTETIVERFHVPAVTEYKYSYPVRVEEYKHSHPVRVEEYKPSSPANRWGRPSSPVHDRPPKVGEFVTKVQTEVIEVPTRPGPLTAMNWRQPRNPPKAPNGTGGYGEYSDEHKYGHPARVEEYKDSSPANRWGRPSSPVHDRPPKVEEFISKVPTEVSEGPTRPGPLSAVNWRQPRDSSKAPNGTGGYGEYSDEHKYSHPARVEEYKDSSPANRWGRPSSPVHDRPPKVEEFISKIQNEVSEVPTRPGPFSAVNWRQPRDPPKAPNGTGRNDDYWNKPSGNVITRSESFDDDDSYRRNDGTKEPTIMNRNDSGRPKHAEWATPPGSKLTRPTSDIGAAVEILKEAAMPSSGQHVPFAKPASTVPNYTQPIDSQEAARRYGNFNATARPYSTGETTIDSKEAARLYGNFNATPRPIINSEEAKEKYKGAKVPTTSR